MSSRFSVIEESLGSEAGSPSFYSPATWIATIARDDLLETEYNLAHQHETVHALQHAFTPFGLATALWRGRQSFLSARMFAGAHRVRHRISELVLSPMATLDGQPPEHAEFAALEMTLSALNGTAAFSSLRAFSAAVGTSEAELAQDIVRACSHAPLPGLLLGKSSPIKTSRKMLWPGAGTDVPLAAFELLEAGAIAVALVERPFVNGTFHAATEADAFAIVARLRRFGRLGPSNTARFISFPGGVHATRYRALREDWFLRVSGARYRSAQLAFLVAYAVALARRGKPALRDRLADKAVQRAMLDTGENQPLEFFLFDETDGERALARLLAGEAADRQESPFLWIFLALIDLALAAPLPPAFQMQVSWYDMHPGWRFLRSLSVMEEFLVSLLSNAQALEDAVRDWSCDLAAFVGRVAERAGWPSIDILHTSLVRYVASSEWVRYAAVGADPALYLCRSLHCLRRIRRPLRWCQNLQPVGSRPGLDYFGEPESFEAEDFSEAWTRLQPNMVFYRPEGVPLRGFQIKRMSAVTNHGPQTGAPWQSCFRAKDIMRNFTFHQTALRRLVRGSNHLPLADSLLEGVCDRNAEAYAELRDVSADICEQVARELVWDV